MLWLSIPRVAVLRSTFPPWRRDAKDFDEFFHVNVAGLFATIQAFYPLLKVRSASSASRSVLEYPALQPHTTAQHTQARVSYCLPVGTHI